MAPNQPLDASLDKLPPTTAPNIRPPFPRSPSLPKIPLVESFPINRRPGSSSVLSSVPALRKHHSTYVLSPPQNQPTTPAPGVPPQIPPRSPARLDTQMESKPKSLTFTAAEMTQEVAPQESSPVHTANEPSPTPVSDSSSPVSTRTRISLTTGTVADVTPWELYPVSTTTARSSLTTGLVEEVTPWELHPVPTTVPIRSTLATGLVEEVTPWELFPSPTYAESSTSGTVSSKNPRTSPRVSTSSSQGKTLAEITHLRRRKSTGTKVPKARSNTLPGTQKQGTTSEPQTTQSHTQSHPLSTNRSSDTSLPKSTPVTPNPFHKVSQHPPVSPAPLQQPSISSQTNSNFSTADRTILEELKRNIEARAAQFMTKGVGSGLNHHGKKHHVYPREEVPYPRNYEREVLDLDVWETAFCQDICSSPTWHVFETPPTKVLDLGCGTGTWVLNCARTWKNSQFVGLDIVPLQPNLQQIGSPDLASRITWVHSNFLDNLPFPNDEFDFVHVKRIALGVPEDKWDSLFEEISRVMKPGGAFEMLEEDLFFPGKPIESDSDSDVDIASEHFPSNSSRRNSSHSDDQYDSSLGGSPHSIIPYVPGEGLPETSTDSPTADEQTEEDEAQELLAQVIVDYASTDHFHESNEADPVSGITSSLPLANRPQLSIRPPSKDHTSGSAVSLVTNSVSSDALVNPTVGIRTRPRPRGYSLTAATRALDTDLPQVDLAESLQNLSSVQIPDTSPFLLRTVPKPPTNPRDHSILKKIYKETLGSRFINISPLALLGNSLGLYFKDIRTHPPLQYAFPPAPARLHRRSTEKLSVLPESENCTSDSDDARDAILPSPVPRSNKRRNSRRISSQSFETEESELIPEDKRYLNIRNLIHHSSPYVTLDESRISALSPSTKTVISNGVTKTTRSQRDSRLPNTTMNLDLRALNLHLALRTAELLACSEPMWEWVLEYQAKARLQKANSPTTRSGSLDAPPRKSRFSGSHDGNSSDPFKDIILELTRNDFDSLLNNFDMDMRDNFLLGNALHDRLSWSATPLLPSPERKVFETACEKWEKWEHEQKSPHSDRTSVRLQRPKSHSIIDESPTSPLAHQFPQNNNNGYGLGQEKKKRKTSNSSTSTLLPSTHRLSRAMRVFVAWKA